jgi:hypothetical protein
MIRYPETRAVYRFAFVALAGVACSDQSSPTAPAVAPATPSLAVAAKPRPRVLYIADIQLSSIYVSLSGGYTPYTVTVTNPTKKDFQGIYLKGELKSTMNDQPPLPASAFLAYCPNPNGIVPRGDCTMSDGITGGATLAPGPGTFTLRVLQQQSDGTMKELDSRTVDVVLRQY